MAYGALIKKSKPVKMKLMEHYLLLINDLPGMQVKSILSPDRKVLGGVNLTFVAKQKIMNAKVVYDNFGTRYIGRYRVFAEAYANSFTNMVDQLGVRTLDSSCNNTLRYGQVFYRVPIFDKGTELDFTASKTQTKPAFTLESSKLRGISYQFTAAVTHPLIRSRTKNLDISLTADWIDSDLYSEAALPRSVLYKDSIRSLRLRGVFDAADKLNGFNYAALELSQGLPAFGASPRKSSSTVLLSRADGKSNYTKVKADAFRLQRFTKYWSALIGAECQYAWVPLLSAEEFGFGGRSYGRGYDPADLIGDRGIAAKGELRLNTAPGMQFLKTIQYYAFCDAGKIWNIEYNNGQPRKADATSIGLGMRFAFTSNIFGEFELSKGISYPVPAEQAAGKSGYNYRGFFSVQANL